MSCPTQSFGWKNLWDEVAIELARWKKISSKSRRLEGVRDRGRNGMRPTWRARTTDPPPRPPVSQRLLTRLELHRQFLRTNH